MLFYLFNNAVYVFIYQSLDKKCYYINITLGTYSTRMEVANRYPISRLQGHISLESHKTKTLPLAEFSTLLCTVSLGFKAFHEIMVNEHSSCPNQMKLLPEREFNSGKTGPFI